MINIYENIRNYGIWRIIWDKDFILSVIISISLVSIHYATGIEVINDKFVSESVQLAVSLLAFIIAGLALLVSFSDEEFLALLKDLEIYDNILFVFQYNIYIAILVSVTGIIYESYSVPRGLFFVYLFAFIYMILSVVMMIDLIVSFGDKKARFELNSD